MNKLKILVVDDESRMRKLVKDFLVKQNYELVEESVFTDDCEKNLKDFIEYREAKEDVILHRGINSCISFADFSVMWLNYKKEYVNPTNGKKISPKTTDLYSDASIFPLNTHAASHICFSKPILAFVFSAISWPSLVITR